MTQINSSGNNTCSKEGKGQHFHLHFCCCEQVLAWKNNFCSKVCAVFSCLSYLKPRACKGTLFQALLLRDLAHMVLNKVSPAGHRGAQEGFQLHRAALFSASKYHQGSREILRNFNVIKEELGQMLKLLTTHLSIQKQQNSNTRKPSRCFSIL